MKPLNLVSLVAWIALVLLTVNTSAAPVIQFSAERIEITEGGLNWIPVESNAEVSAPVVLGLRIVSGVATAGTDFVVNERANLYGTLRHTGFRFDALDDGIPEADESVEVELFVVSGEAVIGQRSRATVVIRNLVGSYEIFGAGSAVVPLDPGTGAVLGIITELPLPEGPGTHLEIRRKGDRHQSLTLTLEFDATREVEVENPETDGESLKVVPVNQFLERTV